MFAIGSTNNNEISDYYKIYTYFAQRIPDVCTRSERSLHMHILQRCVELEPAWSVECSAAAEDLGPVPARVQNNARGNPRHRAVGHEKILPIPRLYTFSNTRNAKDGIRTV